MMRSPFRYRTFLAFLGALLWLLSPPSLAQDEIMIIDEEKPSSTQKPDISLPPEVESGASATNYQTFYEKWRQYVQLVQNGDTAAAQSSAQEILKLQKEQAIPKLTELAFSAVRLGQLQLEDKDPTVALQLFALASQLDPTLPSAYYNESVASMKRGISGLGHAIVTGIQGFVAPRQHLRGRVYFNSKILFLMIGTLSLAGAAFALVMLIKYNHLLRHEAKEKYSRKFSPWNIELAVWIVLFLPVILFLGLLWLAPYWLMIFIRYARVTEKIAAVVLIPAFILAGPAYNKAVHEAELLQDPSVAVFYTVFLEGPSVRAVQDLQAHLSSAPDDFDSAVLLASLYQRNLMTDQAIELLQRLTTEAPQDARPPNNLASIYFARGELDYALRLALKAESLDSRNAAYKFNLSNIYRAKFNFNEASSYMDDAQKTDPKLVEQLDRASHEKVVQVVPTPEILEKRLRGKNRSFFSFLLNPFSILGTLFLAGAVFRIPVSAKKVIARECMKCGKAFCKKCQPHTKVSGFCIQCLHIFVRRDGVSPASRKEKMEEIDSYSRRQKLFSRICSLVLPGAGSLIQDRTVLGFVMLLVWFFLVSLLVFTWKYAGAFFFEPAESFRIVSLICFALMAALYVAVNIPIPRKPKST